MGSRALACAALLASLALACAADAAVTVALAAILGAF